MVKKSGTCSNVFSTKMAIYNFSEEFRGRFTHYVQLRMTITKYYILLSITSAKIIQLNEYGCRDAPCEKSWKQGNPLSNTIKDTSTIMRNPLPKLCREGYA